MLHRLVKRQLKKLDLDQATLPTIEIWQQFLERVSQTYTESERDKYLLERSLTISSQEMRDLYENLRQSSETRLAQERDKLQAVVSAVGDGLCALDQAGRLLFINPAGQQLLGWPELELMGRPLLDMIEACGRDKSSTPTNWLYQIIGAGQPYRNEDGRFKRKDGVVFPTSYILNPIMNKGGLAGSVLVFRDITERKQIELELQKYREHLEEQVAERTTELTTANDQLQQEIAERKLVEEALRESEARKGAILESALDCIIAIDHAGRIVDFNPAAEQIFGYSRDEVLNREMADLIVPPALREQHRQGLARFLATGQSHLLERRIEISALRADGTEFPIELAITPIFSGGLPIFTGFIRDITERKRAEEALAQAHAQALEANRFKTQLLANVSHDLRTPLGAILGYTEILREGIYGPLTDQQSRAVLQITRSTDQLLNFVNNLLNQAQIEVGRLTINISRFELVELVEDVQSMLGGSARASGLELKSDIAPDVPVALYGDPYWLRQILINLVGNAIKFTGKGKVVITIYRPDGDHWALQVSDTGPGIPIEAQAYIFEPFRQVDGTATRGHSGSGLGLSIVKQLTNLMDGQITLESQVGCGSTFTVILPIL